MKTNPKADNLPSQLGFKDLVKEANSGSPEALAQLRHVLDDNPQIWRAVGDLALQARMVLARTLANGDQLVLDSILRHAFELETELLSGTSTPLERLTVQRIVACWLETNYAAVQGPEPTGATLKHARFALQVRESAEKRFNAAIKSYSLVRQLLCTSGKVADRQPKTPAVPDAAANGNGSHHHRSAPPTALASKSGQNGQNGHVPTNRISKHLLGKTNGLADRFRVVSDGDRRPKRTGGGGKPALKMVLP